MQSFGEIRQEHDRIYKETAFPDEAERREIEAFDPEDLFKLPGGAKDGAMRQRSKDGTRFVCVSKLAKPQSTTLRSKQQFFSTALLDELGTSLKGLDATATKEQVQAVVEQLKSEPSIAQLRERYGKGLFAREDKDVELKSNLKAEPAFGHMGLAVKLGLLLLKRQAEAAAAKAKAEAEAKAEAKAAQVRAAMEKAAEEQAEAEAAEEAGGEGRDPEPALTAAALWELVWRHTDDVFCALEDLLDPFKCAVELLVRKLGGDIELRFGDLKDPVRIHEKGVDDYTGDHDDTVIPEACVVDVLRCRAVCREGRTLLELERLLQKGFETTINDKLARLQLLRAKNKFGPNAIDPTRFRNILNNIRSANIESEALRACCC